MEDRNVAARFPNANGEELSARLDSPAGTPRAYALFAHCFTCSKDTLAASRISRSLAAQGIAVLRFDFTGLGSSTGDFVSSTSFSTISRSTIHTRRSRVCAKHYWFVTVRATPRSISTMPLRFSWRRSTQKVLCLSMTLRMYADQKQIPLERVAVRLKHEKIHAQDCAECETKEGKIDKIEREIELTGMLDVAQRARLLEIANKCPVHRTLHAEVYIPTSLKV